MVLMLMVVLCYTICSLSDKYAVAKIKFNGNELTFLMAAATALFMTFTLPFVDTRVIWGIPAVAAILLLTASKMLEFQMSALILQDMSAFELKAWLGICLFVSYFTDIVMKTQSFSWLRLGSDRTSRQKENTLWKDRPSVDRLSGGKIWIWTGDRSSRTVYIFNHVSLFCADPAGVDPSSYGTSGPDLPGKTKRRLICCFDKDSQCGRTFGGECSDRRESGELLLYSADDIGCAFLLGNCPEGGGTRSAQCAGGNCVYCRNCRFSDRLIL